MSSESSAELLRIKVPEIMQRWEERARESVSSTQGVGKLTLRNALPRFLESLAAVLDAGEKTKTQVEIDAAEILNASQEHGRGRARLSLYLMPQVISEYQIMRQTIFEYLEQADVLTQRDRDIIVTFTEEAVNVAATSFVATIKEAQEQFMLSIAHDLRSPLTAARATAELSIKKLEAAVKAGEKSALKKIQDEVIPLLESHQLKAINRLNALIERILDTSKIQAGEPLNLQLQEYDLEKLVLDIASDLNLVHGDCIYVNAEKPIVGMWDAEFLRRCVENIVENGIKYRTPGTVITVTLRETGEKGVIEVHNQGIPIPIQDQAKLFDLHWRNSHVTKGQRGWGFGLAFARGVVEAHHGSIHVESAEGKGTTFIIELPKVPDASWKPQVDRIAG